MTRIDSVAVTSLQLDLANFRTPTQPSEPKAVQAIVATSPNRFWALTESLIESGFLPTDTVLVLKEKGRMVVKDGNRRIGAMKLLLGNLPRSTVQIPPHIAKYIDALPPSWKEDNAKVPCVVYEASEKDQVDRIIALAHAKGEAAGREQWNAVARARHNREAKGDSEPGLDLLEKYLNKGRNITNVEAATWSGDFPLSVLEDAVGRIAKAIGLKGQKDLALTYPRHSYRDELERVMHEIGTGVLKFPDVRGESFLSDYGFPANPAGTGKQHSIAGGSSKAAGAGKSTTGQGAGTTAGTTKHQKSATSVTDPKTLKQQLKRLQLKGQHRAKVVALRDEARKLDPTDTPYAFCFVLRSMLELSAKAFCKDHLGKVGAPNATKADGTDRSLVDVLRDATTFLTKGSTDKAKVRELHGAMAELEKANGLLSVTSMNQLVHNPRFHVGPGDIFALFGNILPLLEELNA